MFGIMTVIIVVPSYYETQYINNSPSYKLGYSDYPNDYIYKNITEEATYPIMYPIEVPSKEYCYWWGFHDARDDTYKRSKMNTSDVISKRINSGI